MTYGVDSIGIPSRITESANHNDSETSAARFDISRIIQPVMMHISFSHK